MGEPLQWHRDDLGEDDEEDHDPGLGQEEGPDAPDHLVHRHLAPRAQFTPKEVETRNEREKLMFRIKVSVDPAWLATHATLAKPGMPGVAYIKLSADTDWPAQLPVR